MNGSLKRNRRSRADKQSDTKRIKFQKERSFYEFEEG